MHNKFGQVLSVFCQLELTCKLYIKVSTGKAKMDKNFQYLVNNYMHLPAKIHIIRLVALVCHKRIDTHYK